MKFRFLTPAETEMMEAAAFYEMQVEKLGMNFIDIIETTVAEIAENPEIWPEIEKGIQRRLVRRFPYSILYKENGAISITDAGKNLLANEEVKKAYLGV